MADICGTHCNKDDSSEWRAIAERIATRTTVPNGGQWRDDFNKDDSSDRVGLSSYFVR
jgi:hypothetical protein